MSTSTTALTHRAGEAERNELALKLETLNVRHRVRLTMPPVLLTAVSTTAAAVSGAPWQMVVAIAILAAAVGVGAGLQLAAGFAQELREAEGQLTLLGSPKGEKMQRVRQMLAERRHDD